MPFLFISCIALYDTYWQLARVGAWKVLACMEHVEMPWYDLAWFNIKFICDYQLLERNTWHLECTKTFHLAPIAA